MNGWGGIGPRWCQPTDRCDLRAKINLHEAGHEIDSKADRSTPGSADVCLLAEDSLDDAVAAFHEHSWPGQPDWRAWGYHLGVCQGPR